MRTGKRTRRRARRRKQIAGACIVILLILLILGLAGILLWRNIKISQRKSDSGKDAVTEQEMTQENKTETITEIQTEAVTEPPVSLGISAEDLYSANAFLVRTKTGETLLDKGSAEQIYPASMTKVMTAVVILENISDLQAEVRLSEEMFDELYRQEASLADYIAGSEEGFADLMNRKAAELGMENTHFVNASGLHDPGHYTTAADMAKLMEYALRNDTFKEIASSAWHSTEPTDMHPDGITVYNTLFGSMTEEIRDSGIITGGKTGYTGEAGLCLASFAEINGETFILVTAGADGNHETEQFHVLDAYAVYRAIKF